MSFTGDLSNELLYKFPKNVIIIAREKDPTTKAVGTASIGIISFVKTDDIEYIKKKAIATVKKEILDNARDSANKISSEAEKKRREFLKESDSAVAQIAQDINFDKNWLRAKSIDELRDLILLAQRRREKS